MAEHEKEILETRDDDPVARNHAKPEEKKALTIGSLLFAGAALSFLAFTKSGKALRQVFKGSKKS